MIGTIIRLTDLLLTKDKRSICMQCKTFLCISPSNSNITNPSVMPQEPQVNKQTNQPHHGPAITVDQIGSPASMLLNKTKEDVLLAQQELSNCRFWQILLKPTIQLVLMQRTLAFAEGTTSFQPPCWPVQLSTTTTLILEY